MSQDLTQILLLALTATLNPSLLAAVTVMLLLPSPKRLMLGYLIGAYATSITAGLLIVSALHGSGVERTSRHTVGPVEDIALGVLALTIAQLLRSGRDRPLRDRRRERKDAKLAAKREAGKPTESLSLRMLGRGDPKVTFAVGLALSFPGVSYIAALDRIHGLGTGTAATVLLVVAFCLIQLVLLELPLLGYAFAPERTRETVTRFRAWMGRSGRTAAVIGIGAIGVLLIIRGVVTLL